MINRNDPGKDSKLYKRILGVLTKHSDGNDLCQELSNYSEYEYSKYCQLYNLISPLTIHDSESIKALTYTENSYKAILNELNLIEIESHAEVEQFLSEVECEYQDLGINTPPEGMLDWCKGQEHLFSYLKSPDRPRVNLEDICDKLEIIKESLHDFLLLAKTFFVEYDKKADALSGVVKRKVQEYLVEKRRQCFDNKRKDFECRNLANFNMSFDDLFQNNEGSTETFTPTVALGSKKHKSDKHITILQYPNEGGGSHEFLSEVEGSKSDNEDFDLIDKAVDISTTDFLLDDFYLDELNTICDEIASNWGNIEYLDNLVTSYHEELSLLEQMHEFPIEVTKKVHADVSSYLNVLIKYIEETDFRSFFREKDYLGEKFIRHDSEYWNRHEYMCSERYREYLDFNDNLDHGENLRMEVGSAHEDVDQKLSIGHLAEFFFKFTHHKVMVTRSEDEDYQFFWSKSLDMTEEMCCELNQSIAKKLEGCEIYMRPEFIRRCFDDTDFNSRVVIPILKQPGRYPQLFCKLIITSILRNHTSFKFAADCVLRKFIPYTSMVSVPAKTYHHHIISCFEDGLMLAVNRLLKDISSDLGMDPSSYAAGKVLGVLKSLKKELILRTLSKSYSQMEESIWPNLLWLLYLVQSGSKWSDIFVVARGGGVSVRPYPRQPVLNDILWQLAYSYRFQGGIELPAKVSKYIAGISCDNGFFSEMAVNPSADSQFIGPPMLMLCDRVLGVSSIESVVVKEQVFDGSVLNAKMKRSKSVDKNVAGIRLDGVSHEGEADHVPYQLFADNKLKSPQLLLLCDKKSVVLEQSGLGEAGDGVFTSPKIELISANGQISNGLRHEDGGSDDVLIESGANCLVSPGPSTNHEQSSPGLLMLYDRKPDVSGELSSLRKKRVPPCQPGALSSNKSGIFGKKTKNHTAKLSKLRARIKRGAIQHASKSVCLANKKRAGIFGWLWAGCRFLYLILSFVFQVITWPLRLFYSAIPRLFIRSKYRSSRRFKVSVPSVMVASLASHCDICEKNINFLSEKKAPMEPF